MAQAGSGSAAAGGLWGGRVRVPISHEIDRSNSNADSRSAIDWRWRGGPGRLETVFLPLVARLATQEPVHVSSHYQTLSLIIDHMVRTQWRGLSHDPSCEHPRSRSIAPIIQIVHDSIRVS
eukprot:4649940-Prymnesium_polylepis.1